MYAARLFAAALFATALAAQTIDPPCLPVLGPIPVGAPTLILGADGAVWRGDQQLATEAVAAAIPARSLFVLAVDRRAPCSSLATILTLAQERGATKVLFAARLPDGQQGAFTLTLPGAADATATVALRLHHERPGVPPASVAPVLGRMVRGVQDTVDPFVVGVTAPADAAIEPVLQVLAAAVAAGAQGALLRCAAAGGRGERGDDGLAIDLGSSPIVRVSARSDDAGTASSPSLRAAPFGLLAPPTATTGIDREGGGAGGRYGGRGGQGGRRGDDAVRQAIGAGLRWLRAQVGPDGAIRGPDGQPDVEATALAVLGALGNGANEAKGDPLLHDGIGVLLDQQRADGSYFAPGHGSVRRTALCAYAMAESYGLLRQGPLLRGSIVDALTWLAAQRQPDGGFTDGNPGGQSDTASTTQCMMAIASGGFFGVKAAASPQDLATWLDLVALPGGGHRSTPTPKDAPATATATGAALFARFFAGQDAKTNQAMGGAADWLIAQADPDDPWCCYWTTYALFQWGGRTWTTWWQKAEKVVMPAQTTTGDDAGSWPPAAGLTQAQTTALRVLTLEAFSRYTRLVR